jgi:hypothetical protein
MGGRPNQISHEIQISSEFPGLPTKIVDNDDSPIRKRKDMNIESLNGPSLTMFFLFFIANSEVRIARPPSLIHLDVGQCVL